MSEELKPCPFCGGEPIVGAFDVECDNAFCEAQPSTAGQSQAEAIAGWNRRTPSPDSQGGAVKELEG